MNSYLFITFILALAFSLTHSLQLHAASLTHQTVDISKYVVGRLMHVNPCDLRFNDPNTLFKFTPNLLTITSCNTYTCPFTLQEYSFTLKDCEKTTNNVCNDDQGPKYQEIFKKATRLALLSNLITFFDSSDSAIIQLRNKI